MIWQTSRFVIDLTRPQVMGIVNVTPDSFSDGGQCVDTASAIARCEQLLRDGADILDIGGESTRPGSPPLGLDEELAPMEGDVVRQVLSFLELSALGLQERGVQKTRIVLDPGIGFGKTVEQNFTLLARQRALSAAGYPLLAGWSRKSSLGTVTGLEVAHRMVPSVAAALLAVERGASVVRVHDVRETVAALAVWQAMQKAS